MTRAMNGLVLVLGLGWALSCHPDPVPLEAECRTGCALYLTCPSLDPDNERVSGCTQSCLDTYALSMEFSVECTDAVRDIHTCYSRFSCEEAAEEWSAPEEGRCGEEYNRYAEFCDGLAQTRRSGPQE